VPVSGPELIRRWAPTRPLVLPEAQWPEFSLDVSNYQKELHDDFFEHWGALGYKGLIVQAVVGLDGFSYTAQQLQAGLDHGWAISAYVWCAAGDALDRGRVQGRLDLIERFTHNLVFVALDVEEMGLSPEDVDADLIRCDEVITDSPLYTGKWAFDNLGWSDNDWWAERRLWDSNYDRTPDVNAGFRPYGGWTDAWMKQFTDEPLDCNVCRR